MKLTADHSDGNTIRSYSNGEIRIMEQLIDTNVIITKDTILTEWKPVAFDELDLIDFRLAIELAPEIILFGTGKKQRFPSIALITKILHKGIAFEVMDTAVACQTFNVLIGEQRKVAAALIV
ncbi:MAG: Mth938-like domain-containing protein [Pseudomonadota bacterium]|nr:Mth938-like domain-containing protein [Pseudomonadota bacterium]